MIDPYAFVGARQPGESWNARHQLMVDALPEQGGTIIVVTNEIGRHLMRGLRARRGFAVRKRWRFISVHWTDDCAKLDGLRGQVIIDWTVAEHATPDAQRRLRKAVAQIQAMQPTN